MKPAHLSVLHLASGDLWAGAEVQLFNLVRALAREPDVTVQVVLLNPGRLEQKLLQTGIKVTILDETRHGPRNLLRRLVALLKHANVDLIHTHRTKENVLGSIAGLAAGGIPSIRTVHGAPEHRPSWRKPHQVLTRKLDELCARYLQDAVVAVSSELAGRLAASFGTGKVLLVENGIDVGEYADLAPAGAAHDSDPRHVFRAGIAGRLVPVKRADLFIDMAGVLKARHPAFRGEFHIYGDGPLRPQLERQCRQLGLTDCVQFHGSVEDFAAELAGLDALVMPSDHEGTPMVLLEALALGVPVIAHDTGGIPEILDHGRLGQLVRDHSAAGYAEALVTAAGLDAGAKSELRARTAALFRKRFNATLCATQYLELYRRICVR